VRVDCSGGLVDPWEELDSDTDEVRVVELREPCPERWRARRKRSLSPIVYGQREGYGLEVFFSSELLVSAFWLRSLTVPHRIQRVVCSGTGLAVLPHQFEERNWDPSWRSWFAVLCRVDSWGNELIHRGPKVGRMVKDERNRFPRSEWAVAGVSLREA